MRHMVGHVDCPRALPHPEHPDWRAGHIAGAYAMTSKTSGHRFQIGPTDYGKWLAVSYSSPYFAFEGDSSEEVEAIANRALDYYFGVSGKLQQIPKGRSQTLSSFSSRKVVERIG
jgi:hypothetical protein